VIKAASLEAEAARLVLKPAVFRLGNKSPLGAKPSLFSRGKAGSVTKKQCDKVKKSLRPPDQGFSSKALRHRCTHFTGWLRMSCSQIRITFHPNRLRVFVTRRSRATFLSNLVRQNSALVTGLVLCLGHPCQKQPSAKTAKRLERNTKSGRPGRRTFLRHPLIECSRKSCASLCSVDALRDPRTRDITSLRLARV
jgi:hypothetical protein